MSVVFTDSFTNSSGSDVRIDQWPSAGSPDYAYNGGSGTNLVVSNANDRVEASVTSTLLLARCIDAAGGITGDQECSATCYQELSQYNESFMRARAASGSQDYYALFVERGEILLVRFDAGSGTTLASGATGLADGARTYTLRATGTNPVALTGTISGQTPVTYSDSSASRKSSGVPGFGIFTFDTAKGYVDDFSVDDLASGSSAVLFADDMQGGFSRGMTGGMA